MTITIGVQGRYFLSFLMLASVVVITVGSYLEDTLGHWLDTQVTAELRRHALSARTLIEKRNISLTKEELDPLAHIFGQDLSLRITFIDASGRVLGDSQRDKNSLLDMENHKDRPEVQEALRGGLGQSKRYSTTLSHAMLYVAIPFHTPQGSIGVVRTAMSLENIRAIKIRLRWVLAVAGLLAAILAASMSRVSAQWATRSLRYVMALAQSMANKTPLPKVDVHPNDEMAGLVGSLNLLAEEKDNTLTQLSEQKSKMAAVLQSMGEGVIALDGNRCITLMNRSVVELLQLSQPLIGQPLDTVFSQKTVAELGLNTLPSEPCSVEFDLDGTPPRRVMVVMTPLHKHPGHVIVLRDVTEIRRLEQVRRDFIANVSHELRTPVSVIQANAQTLLNGALKDKKYSHILADAIERNATRLARIISDLLDLSRLESEHYIQELTRMEILPIVLEVIELMTDKAKEKKIDIETSIPQNFFALTDEELLRRILINFLDNAIKYTPIKSRIDIRIQENSDRYQLEVVDNGPGIAPIHQGRLFERFYRVDSGRSRKMGGTGLGLSIVKHLAEKMGESVGMKDADPQGSLFWVTLSVPSDQPKF